MFVSLPITSAKLLVYGFTHSVTNQIFSHLCILPLLRGSLSTPKAQVEPSEWLHQTNACSCSSFLSSSFLSSSLLSFSGHIPDIRVYMSERRMIDR